MKRFMALAASALTLTALFGLATVSQAASVLELRGTGPAQPLNPTNAPEFTLDLYYTPDRAGIRTTIISTYLLFDDTKFDVTFATSITLTPGPANATGRPTVAQRNALAPTRNLITALTVGGARELSSFNSPVDILGSNPTGLVTTNALFDGDYNRPSSDPLAAVPGLIFPTGGFLIGRYSFSAKSDVNGNYAGSYGDTVIGFADSLVSGGQTLNGEEKSRVEISPTPNPALTFGANGVRRFAVVPAPSSVAVMALGGLMPLIAIARRRRAAK